MSEQSSPPRTRQTSLIVRGVVSLAASVGLIGVLGAGCLTRPVVAEVPTTKTNFIAAVRQASVDKLDILFMIDNSASMGDKQELLKAAVPDLITRLVTPNCVDDMGNPVGKACTPDGSGKCTCATGKVEFPPVHDMHIGIVSSSLGGEGSDQCAEPTANPVNGASDTHNNDRGELINRSDLMGDQSETAVTDANPANFLAWLPPVAANTGKPNPPVVALKDANQLSTDFQDMVSGVHEYGCGFEAQDEAWYRFLIQPDPYDHISRDLGECAGGAANGMTGRTACYVGVDTKILQERHDFLRSDSLVAVIMVSDENSGEAVDPLSIGGQGWAYMDNHFPGGPGPAASGTSVCGQTPTMGPNPGPNDPNCTSCGFETAKGDPNCMQNGGFLSAAADSINVRGVYDKQRFGVDPRYPVTRYVTGLKSFTVPDRAGEHSGGAYVGNNNCSNPLFSTNLPVTPGNPGSNGEFASLCKLTKGPRTPDLVFLAAITGVPHQLLQAAPGDPECPKGTDPTMCPQKGTLLPSDWTKILGKDPEHYDFSGIDPHMFVSINPRQGLQPPAIGNGTDPINGRDWNTQAQDQQYACTFTLTTPRDCTLGLYKNACDCTAGKCDACMGDPTKCSCPPLCGDGTTNPFTTQTMAKAYPAPRELEEVELLAGQGIVSSLCPISLDTNSPLYGYRPAVSAIVDRLKNALASQCLPQKLTPNSCGSVTCLILETLASGTTTCDPKLGLSLPDPQILQKFQQSQHDLWASNGGADAGLGPDPTTLTTCEVTQLVPQGGFDPSCSTTAAITQGHYQYVGDFQAGSCAGAAEPGWCYAAGAAAGGSCAQAILFSANGNPQVGAQISLQCIESSGGGSDAGGGGGG